MVLATDILYAGVRQTDTVTDFDLGVDQFDFSEVLAILDLASATASVVAPSATWRGRP